MKTVLVSGGFDPIHPGHIRYINESAKHGSVVVALNSDSWLKRKKGFYYMPFDHRKEILLSMKGVSYVYPVDDADNTVSEAIRSLRPDFFANGGDRHEENTPEINLCNDTGVSLLFNIGGGKTSSSSEIVQRDWGFYRTLYDEDFKVKILTVLPGRAISLQRHKFRNEHWIFTEDNSYKFIKKQEIHQLINDNKEPMVVVEVQTGTYFGEDDIERL